MHRENIDITVVMSIYNEKQEWIRLSIESILNQTFSNFEFIIINDKPDRKENKLLLEEYAHIDNRIIVIENEKNIGLTKSLNKGLRLAKGEYIARMDADDISLPERFQEQYDFMLINPSVLLCGSMADKIDEKGGFLSEYIYPEKNSDIKKELYKRNCFIHPTFFFHSSLCNKYNLFYNEDLIYAQDYEFICQASIIGEIVNIGNKLLQYRISDNQIGNGKYKEQYINANEVRSNFIKSFFEKQYGVCDNIPTVNEIIKIKRNDKNEYRKDIIDNILFSLVVNFRNSSFFEKFLILKNTSYSFMDILRVLKS